MEVKTLLEISLQDTDLVLLDLDNTLYDYADCHRVAQKSLFEYLGEQANMISFDLSALYDTSRRNTHNRLLGTASSHSRLFYIQEIVERLFGYTDIQLILLLNHLYWNTFIDRMKLFTDVIPFFERLKKMDVPVIIVTDMTTEIQFKKIQKLEIEKYLSFVVTSEEAGVEKPHPYIFELAIIKAGRIKGHIKNVVVIGDDIKKDYYVSEKYSVAVNHLER